MRSIKKIVVHHSASPPETTVEEIDAWHKARGWWGIGYHYVVDHNGEIQEGRPLKKPGAHTKGHNRKSIGICVTGNFEDYHCPKHRFDALVTHIQTLLYTYDLKWNDVYYHKEFAATACCGRFLIEQLRQYRKGRVVSGTGNQCT